VILPGEGERLGNAHFKVTGSDGLGLFSFAESNLPPGEPGPPLHIHDTHDEAFYVVRGDLTMQAGDEVIVATPGTFVFVPAGMVHGFANRTESIVTFVGMHSPGDYAEIFRELEALRLPDGALNRAANALPAKYHDRIVGRPLGMRLG